MKDESEATDKRIPIYRAPQLRLDTTTIADPLPHCRYEDAKRQSRVQYCFELYAVGQAYRDQPRTNPLALLVGAAHAALRAARALFGKNRNASAPEHAPASEHDKVGNQAWRTACNILKGLVESARGRASSQCRAWQSPGEYLVSKARGARPRGGHGGGGPAGSPESPAPRLIFTGRHGEISIFSLEFLVHACMHGMLTLRQP